MTRQALADSSRTRAGSAVVVRMAGVAKSFAVGTARETHALCDVSLQVRVGEFVVLLGASGSGKTTLLNLAAGLDTPTAGTVELLGVTLNDSSAKHRRRLQREHVGFIFQEESLIGALTAVENAALPLELAGSARGAARQRADEALANLGLTDRRDLFPDELSGGEAQRVAVARVAASDMALLLADEPTGSLDADNAETVLQAIARACDNGAAALVATHDLSALEFADRVVRLRDGRIVAA